MARPPSWLRLAWSMPNRARLRATRRGSPASRDRYVHWARKYAAADRVVEEQALAGGPAQVDAVELAAGDLELAVLVKA
jgi:hypothetical protein